MTSTTATDATADPDRHPGDRQRARTARLALAASLLLVLAGCGGGGGKRGAAGDAGRADRSGTQAATTLPAAEPTCEDDTVAGRPVVLCTAGDRPGQGLVVALHGRGSSAGELRAVTALEHEAAAHGLAVAYPESLDGGWGDDTFATPTRPAGDEDVAFLDALIDALQADDRIGEGPVGLVGFSNGGSMVLRYAAERPDRVRGVVSVAGQLPRDPAVRPPAPVPLLEIYGTADPLRPYDTGIPQAPERQPGQPTPTLSTRDTVAAFVEAAEAGPEPAEATETDGDPDDGTRVRTERWTGRGGVVVVLRIVEGGGHTWPSARAMAAGAERFGTVSREIDASADAIAFLVDPGAVGA